MTLKEGDRIEYRSKGYSWFTGITGRITELMPCLSGTHLYVVRWDDGQSEACTEQGFHKIAEDAPIVTHSEAMDMYMARKKGGCSQ